MNVFPTSLASMNDLRACAHKQLPELFPADGPVMEGR